LRRGKTHQKFIYPVRVESISPSIIKEPLQKDTKSYRKLTPRSSSIAKPNFTFFFPLFFLDQESYECDQEI